MMVSLILIIGLIVDVL